MRLPIYSSIYLFVLTSDTITNNSFLKYLSIYDNKFSFFIIESYDSLAETDDIEERHHYHGYHSIIISIYGANNNERQMYDNGVRLNVLLLLLLLF